MTSILDKQAKKPLAITIDDDPDFNKMMALLLRRLGVDSKTTSTPEEFLKAVKKKQPDLCVVDLNFGDLDAGFLLIKAIRSVLGPEMPLIVCSSVTDRQSIAHALEIGANDFVVKPVDQGQLADKLKLYVDSEQLEDAGLDQFMVPPDHDKAYLSVSVSIAEIDELGVKLLSPHLVSKGTVVYLDHAFIHQVTGKPHPVLVTVTNTWVEADGACGAYAEFDEGDDELRAAVRRWIAANVRTGPAPPKTAPPARLPSGDDGEPSEEEQG